MLKKGGLFVSVVMLFAVLASCSGGDYIPKPRGYFRIDFPEQSYQKLDSVFPYTFEYPVYTEITPDIHSPNEKNWININFPDFKGILHLSYKPVNGNLIDFMEDSRTMAFKHIPKASAIDNRVIFDPEKNVFGLIYEISGSGSASPYQFFVTDSSRHFLRGALYFNIVPNNDSMAPVIGFIKKDIEHLIETLEWKDD